MEFVGYRCWMVFVSFGFFDQGAGLRVLGSWHWGLGSLGLWGEF